MLRARISWPVGAIPIVLALALAGCSKNAALDDEENMDRFELREIGYLYDAHVQEKSRPPAKLADLKSGEVLYPNGFQALKNGQCVAVWGLDLSKVPDAGKTVLAYRKDVPTQGGWVLMADLTTIKKLTPEEFKAVYKPRT